MIKYNNKMHIFAMNGQTGEFIGNIPLDKIKTLLYSIFIFIISILQIVINNIFSDYKLFFSIKNILIYLIIFVLSLVIIGGKSVYIFVKKSIAESI